jgi:hypothetical protein
MTDSRLTERLDELKEEYRLGDARLRDLTQQEVVLRETLLRISGAIQVPADPASPDTPGGYATVAPGRSPWAAADAEFDR